MVGARAEPERASLPKPEIDPQSFNATIAGLCRFYGGTPGVYLAMPVYQLRVLVDHLAALEAKEQMAMATAASAPHMKTTDRRRYLRELEGLTWRLRPAPPARPEPTEIDPVKAAEWFAAQGYEVTNG